jgi:hypothetical protein
VKTIDRVACAAGSGLFAALAIQPASQWKYHVYPAAHSISLGLAVVFGLIALLPKGDTSE